MSVAPLLAEAVAAGIELRPDGWRIRLSAACEPPPGLLDCLRAREAGIATLLEAAAVADVRRRAANGPSPEALADEAELTVRGEDP